MPRPDLAPFWLFLILALATLAGFQPIYAVDENANGMSDVWEAVYGKSLDPTHDNDGDGKTNRQESNAGTNPSDPASVHHVQSISSDGSIITLNWPTVPGKVYQIEVSHSLNTTEWQAVGTPQMGDGEMMMRQLPLDTTFLTGHALLAIWRSLPSDASWRLDRIIEYATTGTPAPTEETTIAQLDTPANSDDYYGQWLRGWLVPPATGPYTFYLASDDRSELRLATSNDPASATTIAFVSGHSGSYVWDKYPEQTSAPIQLNAGQAYYFETFMTEGQGGDHLSVAWSGPGLPQQIIDGAYVATGGSSLAELQNQAGGALFFRVTAADTDSDADGVTDFEEIMARLDPMTGTTIPRAEDLNTVLGILNSANTVTIGSSVNRGYEDGLQTAQFTIHRSGGMEPLQIGFSISGTATSGLDFLPLPPSVSLSAAENATNIQVHPLLDDLVEPAETVVLTLNPGMDYLIGSPSESTIRIDDAEDVLYVATLRGSSQPGETSGGYGYAALRVAGNQLFGKLQVEFGNLTALQIDTEIFVSSTGSGGEIVLALPPGQINDHRWEFDPAGSLSREQILTALDSNELHLRIKSEAFPLGEISGTFLANEGWQSVPTPPAVPTPPETLPGASLTAQQAARFLIQASYGPTTDSITDLQAKGIDAWLNEQLAMAPTLHLPLMQARRQQALDESGGASDGWQSPRHETWWQIALTSPDQLRQRMAFALSEIFVISELGVLDSSHEGVTNWYDMLATNAFGNYRELLEKVTLSPIMGQYLSMVRNRKPDPTTGSEPDENYAREVMQLFSIGLSRLNLDGSLQLDANGMPIPTYTQDDIVGLAHVFTGWGYGYTGSVPPNFFWGPREDLLPMVQYPDYHDTNEKRLIDGAIIPAGQTGEEDLNQALDLLANHPNVAPFMARRLIQRFVTSNPSPGYIYRVASVFNETDGDLGETLRAILTDHEARSVEAMSTQTFGKQREPVLRYTHLARAMQAQPPVPNDSWYYMNMQYSLTHQAPLRSPSVFNFFQPDYLPSGTLADAGLVAPEFQITSETTTILQANTEHHLVHWGQWTPREDAEGNHYSIRLDYADEIALLQNTSLPFADNLETLLQHLNLKMLAGQMSPELDQAIRDAWASLPSWYNETNTDHLAGRVRLALYLILQSPEYAIQK